MKTSCLVCLSLGPFEVVASSLRGSPSSVVLCKACRTEFLDPMPSFEEIRGLYTAEYYKAWGMAKGDTSEVAEMKKMTFANRIQELGRFVQGGRILDVGTASGFFLEVAREAGFEPFGVELSEYSGKIAAAKFGRDRIHIGTLETAPFDPGTFDAISMSDLLEHVTDPLSILRHAYRLLRPGGYLQITTPDTNSLSRRLMGRAWTHYKLEHLFYWNSRSITRMAHSTGFRVALCKPAEKVMNISYLRNQLCVYKHWALTPFLGLLHSLCRPFGQVPIRLRMGEMVAILERP